MPKLSVVDLAMFLFETPERPFGIGPLMVLRPPGSASDFADELMRGMLAKPAGPPFNFRLRTGLARVPSVEPMAEPDVSAHVHRISLGGQASINELVHKVCELHETPLARDGLLWELYLIDGIAGGRVAIYGKVHHGLIDGKGFVEVVTRWLSTDPADRQVRAMWEGLKRRAPEAAPRDGAAARLGWRAMRDALAQSTGLLGSGLGLSRMLMEQGMRSLGLKDQALALPFVNVPKALTGTPQAKRSFAFTLLPIEQVKALGKTHDATINDILLTVLDMALDRYMDQLAQGPGKPLVVDMPVALGAKGGGNQIAVLQLPLARPGMAPLERLAAIRAETGRLKAQVKRTSSETMMLHTTLTHAVPTALERVGLKRHPLRLSNLVFSNPFGLPGRQYLMGAEVELLLPMSVVAPGQMLNATVVTLGEQLQLGFLAMPKAVPSVHTLAQFTSEALAALQAASAAAHPAVRSGRRAVAVRVARVSGPRKRKPAAPAPAA